MTQPTVTAPRPIAKHAAARRRRRWPWVALILGLLLVALVAFGGLWYASDQVAAAARVDSRATGYPLSVTTVGGGEVSYTTPGDGVGPADQGLMGLVSIFGGYSQSDAPEPHGQSTSRRVNATVVGPPLAQNQPITLDPWYFPRNPQVGLGLEYEDVDVDTPLGPTPGWLIPGTSSTWVVYVHGLGATPLEGLRIARTANASGHPVLLIRYRNDARAPEAGGYGQYGVAEWPDLEAAVQYALDHDADRVVVAGTGMGGSIALSFLANSDLAPSVSGLFLDSPVVDARAVVEAQAAARGVPSWATGVAAALAAWRFGFSWADSDYTGAAAATSTPTQIVQGAADADVPAALAQRFAESADADVVSLETVEGAGYGQAWNVDRAGYERLLTDFLTRVA